MKVSVVQQGLSYRTEDSRTEIIGSLLGAYTQVNDTVTLKCLPA